MIFHEGFLSNKPLVLTNHFVSFMTKIFHLMKILQLPIGQINWPNHFRESRLSDQKPEVAKVFRDSITAKISSFFAKNFASVNAA
jgi:hypothetical protein